MKTNATLVMALTLISTPAFATKACDELKAEIEVKLQDKGVKTYTLDIVPTEDVADERVVGTCEGGARKITYKRGV
jgi:hypothetical protein